MVTKISIFVALIPFLLILLFYPQSILNSLCRPKSSNDILRKCISNDSILYFPNDPSYEPIYEYTLQNLRLLNHSNPKPVAILTPLIYSHVQKAILCSKEIGVQIRVRSGGHDYEGMSYTSQYHLAQPFLLVDLVNLTSVTIDMDSEERKTALVQGGATLGQLYYWINNKTQDYGFPGGICPSVGVGGLISGGGIGYLTRKYGLAADNVIDALIVNVSGQILDRQSMGEDLFWAIKGGGVASFGVLLSWRVQLVSVPRIVTVFNASRSLEQGAIELIWKCQLDCWRMNENLRMRIQISTKNQKTKVTFSSVFLGTADELLSTLEASFPGLDLTKEEFKEMSMIEAAMYFYYPKGESKEALRDRKPIPSFKTHFKSKSDFVTEPMSREVLNEIWNLSSENENFQLVMFSHGGKMGEIPDDQTPFPFRKGILYDIEYMVLWKEDDNETATKNINWIRMFYEHMTPYVTKNPRGAYSNFRDFDLGVNNDARTTTAYEEARRSWGVNYFKNNFERLALVKSKVDPKNFFVSEQTIPPHSVREENFAPSTAAI